MANAFQTLKRIAIPSLDLISWRQIKVGLQLSRACTYRPSVGVMSNLRHRRRWRDWAKASYVCGSVGAEGCSPTARRLAETENYIE